MIDLTGCGTALVTPFKSSGEPDLEVYSKFVQWQIDSGINFLVPVGTTGESVTLKEEEYSDVIRTCVETASGAVPVLAGAGTNNTAYAVHLAQKAEQLGADALLAVTPYYKQAHPGRTPASFRGNRPVHRHTGHRLQCAGENRHQHHRRDHFKAGQDG